MALSDHEREVLAALEAQLREDLDASPVEQDSPAPASEPAGEETEEAKGAAEATDAPRGSVAPATKPAPRPARPTKPSPEQRATSSSLSFQRLFFGAVLLLAGLGVIVVGVTLGSGFVSLLVGVAGFLCALFGGLYALTPVSGKPKRPKPKR
ncbi:MAG: hypothetical protein Q3999_04410 [Buchananella hordeovulneris]|nr:hypothetical protein [Buchananella hordeovulneris]